MTCSINLILKKVIALLVCAVLSFCFVGIVAAQSTTVNAVASTNQPVVGSTLTVTLTISNVQNLFAIDSTLLWNSSVLSLTNVGLNLGDSHSNGVLHGNNLNYDSNNLNSGDIFVQETKVSGSYHLVSTSVGASTSGFTGSGTIATLTFNVVSTGAAGLSLQSELADHPPAGQNANNIDHNDVASSVTAITHGSSTTPTPSVPEFSITIIIILFVAITTAGTVIVAKQRNKTKIV
jgi:hypothetical protein